MKRLVAGILVVALIVLNGGVALASEVGIDREIMQITAEVIAEYLDKEAAVSVLDDNSATIMITLENTSETTLKLAVALLGAMLETISATQKGTGIDAIFVKYITPDYTPIVEFVLTPSNPDSTLSVMYNPTFLSQLKSILE